MQSVIVYRNPIEAAVWEFVANTPVIFPLAMALLTHVASYVILAILVDKLFPRFYLKKRSTSYHTDRDRCLTASQVVSLVIASFTFFYLYF